MNEQTPPVSAGETHEVEIQSVGEKGDGIARVRGFVLFVPGVKKGDYVKIKITKVLQKVGFADVVGKAEKPERPVYQKKFETVDPNETVEEEKKYEQQEDTEDFGSDLEDE